MKVRKVGKTFIKHIPYIETVMFYDGGFFLGHQITTVTFKDDSSIYTTKRRPFMDNSIPREGMSKAEFLAEIEALHIEEWAKDYESFDQDGEQWELSIRFSNGHRPVKIYGSNAFPPNFKKLQQLMKSPFVEEKD